MRNSKTSNQHLARLHERIKQADYVISLGMILLMVTSLSRVFRIAATISRIDALHELIWCAITVFGLAFVWMGIRLSTQAMVIEFKREDMALMARRTAAAKHAVSTEIAPGTKSASRPTRRMPQDEASLNRAVWALARQTKVR